MQSQIPTDRFGSSGHAGWGPMLLEAVIVNAIAAVIFGWAARTYGISGEAFWVVAAVGDFVFTAMATPIIVTRHTPPEGGVVTDVYRVHGQT